MVTVSPSSVSSQAVVRWRSSDLITKVSLSDSISIDAWYTFTGTTVLTINGKPRDTQSALPVESILFDGRQVSPMTGLWTYPWSFSTLQPERTISTLTDADIDHLKVAAHYHSVRTFDPKADPLGFDTFPGGCLFDPDEECFDRTPIEPPRNEIDGRSDPFTPVVDAARRSDVAVDAWLVCFHGTRLASRWPEYQVEDAFGDAHDHALCPSHSEVRQYFASLVRNLARYDLNRIDLESIGFPSVVHGHGGSFGHHKDHVIMNRADEFLVSQCFCDGCRREARNRNIVDLEAAEEVVKRLCERYLTVADETPPLAQLVAEHSLLEELFAFRAAIVSDLLEELAAVSGKTRLAYYIADGGGYTPPNLWPAGVTPDNLEASVDDVTALCYTSDLDTIDKRLTACQDSLSHPLDAGLTLDPSVIDDREQWEQLVDYVSDRIDGDIFVYNHSLLTDSQLEWVSGAESKPDT